MIFKLEQIEEMYFEKKYDVLNLIENGQWISDYKSEYQKLIFEYENKYFMLDVQRAGDEYSDYDYFFNEDKDGNVECPEVEKKEVVKYEWVVKEVAN